MFDFSSHHFEKRIESLPTEPLHHSAISFLSRHEHNLQAVSGGAIERIDLVDPRDFLRAYLASLKMKVSGRVYFQLSREDNFEIWSNDLRFLGTGNQLIKRLSYTVHDLLTLDWKRLFVREPDGERLIEKGLARLSNGEELVLDVAPFHRVSETGANKVSALVRVKCLAIARDITTDARCGVVAITTIRD